MRGLDSDLTSADRLWGRTSSMALGSFHAGPASAAFGASGPYAWYYLVFPRTTTEVRPHDAQPCVCSPALLVFHEPGTRLERRAISPEGDGSDYIAISSDALGTLGEIGSTVLSGESKRTRRTIPVEGAWLAATRSLVRAGRAGSIDAVEIEERLLPVVAGALSRIVGGRPSAVTPRGARDLAEDAKRLLADRHQEAWSLMRLSRTLHTDPCHLARMFKRQMGIPIHQYLVRLRLCAGYDAIIDGRGSLSKVANELGFAHHSHLTSWYRRTFGSAPTRAAGWDV